MTPEERRAYERGRKAQQRAKTKAQEMSHFFLKLCPENTP